MTEDGTERQVTGHIVSYDATTDAYLVAYDPEDSDLGISTRRHVWEQERRKRTAAMRHNPSLAGKSRFTFLEPPASSKLSQRRLSACNEGYELFQKQAEMSRDGASSSSSAGRQHKRTLKQELRRNVRYAPSRMLQRLEGHSDEVLYVVFSPCGTRLASCSRDLKTMIVRVRYADYLEQEGEDATLSSKPEAAARCRRQPMFETEAIFPHQTSPCRATWWPAAPYDLLVVSTEDAGWQGASKAEIWQILPPDAADAMAMPADGLPVGHNARCLFQGHSRPFDIYAAIIPWPPPSIAPLALGEDLSSRLCFLAGCAVFREYEHYVQCLNVWPGPQHPSFRAGAENAGLGGLTPLARIRLEGEMNYLHCLEAGPGEEAGLRILAMTGSTPHLCDEIGMLKLDGVARRQNGVAVEDRVPTYEAPVVVKGMGERVVLSAKWNQRGDMLFLNTRPYARPRSNSGSSSATSPPPPQGGQRPPQAGPLSRASGMADSFEDLLSRPAPDLSTSMELLIVDSQSLDTIGVFDGHFAFTTKESPFLIFTDEWGDSDFLASGGEDHHVYIWHRRHRRLIRRLCGHTEPVNAVSWNGSGLLASASDDHSIIIWSSAWSPLESSE
eukprot:TRINITY_DN7709_c1_g2_i1.p1 TRINITY_DN7709_c1_g2~~TRINITY_DN7709_c1_g2_i1.p1  ORF type:complete len:706 (+),score=108.20 TRINITY_DN7709_c1_g2_i1:285-2120(+)